MNKLYGMIALVVVVIGIITIGGVGYNEDSNFTVIQPRIGGDPVVKGDNGMYFKWFGVTDTYPDKDIIYFSKDVREGSEIDESIPTLFTDKGKGYWDFQVTVRNPTSSSDQVEFHRMVKGDYENYRNALNARLKDAGRKYAESKTASEAAENQSGFKDFVENAMMEDNILDSEFHAKVISVELVGVDFDPKTDELFEKQQESLLLKKQAQIDAEKFEQQTLSTKAEYAQKIEAQKGEADMIAMKAVTDAEREKELAEIAANQKVEVAKLETLEQEALKAKALIEAQRGLEVATLERETANEQAEAQKLLADAREYQLERGGAMSEREQVTLEIMAKRDAMVASELAKINVPHIVIGGGGEGGSNSTLTESMFQMGLMSQMGLFSTTNNIAK